MQKIIKLIEKGTIDSKRVKNLYGVCEDGKQVDLQIVGNRLCYPVFNGKEIPLRIEHRNQEDFELGAKVVKELEELYGVTNLRLT